MLIELITALTIVAAPVCPFALPPLPGWTPKAPDYGPVLVDLLSKTAASAPDKWRKLTPEEQSCWWAKQLYETIWADFHATSLRLRVQPPDPSGPGAATSLDAVSAGWLRRRQRTLRKAWEQFTEWMGEYCPGGGGQSAAYHAFDDASGDWLWGELDPYQPERAGWFDPRLVVPARGWSPETLVRATLELRRRKQSPEQGLACGC